MSVSEIKKELKKLDQAKLIDLIMDLYRKHKPVKEYLDFFVQPDEKALFQKYQDLVVQAFFPKRGYNYSLAAGKKAIADFKKLGTSVDYLAELMLVYVESGVRFTKSYGDINEAFYASIEGAFEKTLQLMKQEGLLAKFATRTKKVIADTKNMGWGFNDSLSASWGEFYA